MIHTWLPAAFDLAALVLLPPLLVGIANRTKALFAGRRGQPLLQGYRDLARLSRKDSVLSETTTWVFGFAPFGVLAATLMAGLFLPLGSGGLPIAFEGDAILFAYLFALGRFLTATAALDTGSPFEGMGAAREVSYAFLAEPALIFALLVLIRLSGSLSLGPMLGASSAGHVPSVVLCVVGLAIVLLLEGSRIPFDDPNTHLELTMIHEVMVLDHSGPLLGTVLYGAWMKLFVLSVLVVRLALPAVENAWAGRVMTLVGLVVLAIAIGVVESVTARLRIARLPSLISAAALLTAFAFLLMVR